MVPGELHAALVTLFDGAGNVQTLSGMCGSRECLVRLTRALVEAVFFVISSAGATGSSVRQLHHDRVVPGKSHNAQTSALRPVQVGPESQMCGSRECLVRLTRALVEAVFP